MRAVSGAGSDSFGSVRRIWRVWNENVYLRTFGEPGRGRWGTVSTKGRCGERHGMIVVGDKPRECVSVLAFR